MIFRVGIPQAQVFLCNAQAGVGRKDVQEKKECREKYDQAQFPGNAPL